ncbi:hypothetical protein RFA78_001662 [Campylobacter coli]|uniref:hypothetical protein n=1 Tax=Campylobacter coli TaxID=195 RepID=UPI0015B569B9|nr:hypothetical protein [Campylobacter coli]EIG9186271.1 hypothetical protein [Campylobacter coli]EKP0072406.1 hypothetical protein [Campylobacter coli]EKZ8838273.1 hypothetical protein [Campylobacter coli]ELK0855808.1 hypothetical protein [Campylobacter coli]QLD91582.1 hypothetical protein HXP32_01715 [Campylobacter coli]
MTIYVHIGTVKTGTTTIQKFLYLNRKQLLKHGFHHPQIFDQRDYWLIVPALKNLKNNLNSKILQNKVIDFCKDIVADKKNIISSEALSHRLISLEDIYFFYQFLHKMGFSKIYIVIYFRDILDVLCGLHNTQLKIGYQTALALQTVDLNQEGKSICNYRQTIENWGEVFGRENLIVRLFDKDEFYQGDLLKDFIHSIGLEWDDEFIIPPKQNESLDLLGIELLRKINRRLFPFFENGDKNPIRGDLRLFCEKHFTSKDFHLKFQPPKEVVQSYIDYFEESNEWVRKEFFPHKERLFPKKNLSNYKENYELKEMKPEYWDKIAEFIADIVKTKNQNIADKTNIIQNKDKIITDQTTQIKSLQVNIKDSEVKLVQIQTSNNTLSNIIKEKDNIINSNINQINQLQNNIQEKSTQLNQIQSKLSFQTKYGTAKTRIQNQLSYKLGQAMIVNSKSFLGYLIMPMALLSIMISHKQEQKIYQEKIKKDTSLKLPPLENYPDYQEALKLKNQFSYKLGEALIQANKTWYKGGGMSNCYLKLGS